MFDVTKPFHARLSTSADGQPVIVSLRYPTDKEWDKRAQKHPAVKRVQDRHRTDFEDTDTSEHDLALINELLEESSARVTDGYAAAKIINTIDRSEVESCDRRGSGWELTMVVYGRDKEQPDGKMRTTHLLREPTEKQVNQYFTRSTKSSAVRKSIQTVAYLEPGAKLYDELFIEADGYAGAPPASIPINHKNAIIWELCLEVSRMNAADNLPPEV